MQELQQAISQALHRTEPALRLAILGIGQELRGDDAAGVLLVRNLSSILPPSDNLLLIEAGPAPENFTSSLRRFRPGLVILADIAWMDKPPGAVQWLIPESASGISALTHTLPLNVVAGYLSSELGCEVRILAIQPVQVDFDQPVSEEVSGAIRMLVDEINLLG